MHVWLLVVVLLFFSFKLKKKTFFLQAHLMPKEAHGGQL